MVRFSGFTLVEILVIVALLGMLSISSVIYLPAQLAKARDARRKGDVNLIGKYIEEYNTDKGCYPVSVPTCINTFSLGDKVYIPSLPCDPSGNSYVYVSEISSCPSWFQLYGDLEYQKDDIIDRLGCRNGCGPKCQFNYGTSSPNVKLNPFCQDQKTPSSSASPQPTSEPTKLQYACTPGGVCTAFMHPELSGCPDIYLNDATCQNQCVNPKNRCHDERGKTN